MLFLVFAPGLAVVAAWSPSQHVRVALPQELDMALEAHAQLRELHPSHLTSAAYAVLMNSCASESRDAEGLDLFGLLRLDWQTTGNHALQPTAFVYR